MSLYFSLIIERFYALKRVKNTFTDEKNIKEGVFVW